jgi:hypothetical protein
MIRAILERYNLKFLKKPKNLQTLIYNSLNTQ